MNTIEVGWIDTNANIGRVRVTDGWTWTDLEGAFSDLRQMGESVPGRMSVVFECDTWRSPKGVMSRLGELASLPYFERSEEGIIVFVGARGMIGAMTDIMGRVYLHTRDRMRFAQTTDEALEVIADYNTRGMAFGLN